MQIHISPIDGIPIYQQIVNQIKYLVSSGRLEPDDELPPVRVLAEQLLINPNTVVRAYRELETSGIVYKRKGAGTYVSGKQSPLSDQERVRIVTDRADSLLVEARQMGYGLEEVVKVVRDRDQALSSGIGFRGSGRGSSLPPPLTEEMSPLSRNPVSDSEQEEVSHD
jgi:GntR family transcriptional regulator